MFSVMGALFIALVITLILSVLKLVGLIAWSWLLVTAPMSCFYVLYWLAMFCFLYRQRIVKRFKRKE